MTERKETTVAGSSLSVSDIVKLTLGKPGCYRVLALADGLDLSSRYGQGPHIASFDARTTTMSPHEVAEQLVEDCFAGNAPMVYLTDIVKQIALAESGWYLPGYPFVTRPFKAEKQARRIEAVFSEKE